MAQVKANPVLVQSNNGIIHVSGLADGVKVNAYGTNGTLVGSAVGYNGMASVNTNLSPGSIVILKVGGKSVKITVK